MKQFAGAIAIFMLAGIAAAANEPGVTAKTRLTPPVVPFHKTAALEIIVEAPASIEIDLQPLIGRLGGLETFGMPERSVDYLEGDLRRITETYTLDPLFPGQYAIEPIEITWENQGKANKIVLPGPSLTVRDLTEQERAEIERFEPNAGPMALDEPLLPWWAIAAVIAVLLLGAAAAYWYYRRPAAAGAIAAPKRAPWDIAYEQLRELDAKRLPDKGEAMAYYVILSDILRQYIERRFNIHAPEQTTPEFLGDAARSGAFSNEHQRLLAHFLRHCDLVKFAQYVPATPEMEQSFTEVLRFVDETVPQEPQVEEQAA